MPDERDIRRGRRRLLQLLPWALKEARKPHGKMHAESVLGAVTFSHVRPWNLDALVVYPAPLGGWHGDLILEHMPDGIPNVLGTPVAHPLPTREAAEEYCKRLLVGILKQAAETDAAAPPMPPAFLFYQWTITLNPAVYVMARQNMPWYLEALKTSGQDLVIERIESFLSENFPSGYQGEEPETWPRLRFMQFLAVVHQAAFVGVFAYPVRTHGKPTAH